MVSPVIRQGACNDCWAYTAAGSMEFWLRKQTPDAEVSVQHILDCSPSTFGCRGGLMENVYTFKGWYKIGREEQRLHRKTCRPCTPPACKGVRVKSYQIVDQHVESVLASLVYAYGPVPVAIDMRTLHGYTGGVVTTCSNNPDHAMLVVGYTPEYWILKNSYGAHWGENGYVRIVRGQNMCGIDLYAAVVTGIQ